MVSQKACSAKVIGATLSTTEEQQFNNLVQAARENIKSQQVSVRETWVRERLDRKLPSSSSHQNSELESMYRKAIESQVLALDYEIVLEDGHSVLVREIMAEPEKFHGRRCRDPIEPEYHNDNRIGYISTSGCLSNIWSHAHGGQRFVLEQLKPTVQVITGSPNKAASKILQVMRDCDELYSHSNRVVDISTGSIRSIRADEFMLKIHDVVNLVKANKNGTLIPIDIPIQLNKSIHASASNRLKPLIGLLNHPTLRRDGSLICVQGYDQKAQVYLNTLHKQNSAAIENPTKKQSEWALRVLFRPFQNFPFHTDNDRAVFVSALLTSAIRRTLPTAPGFLIEASTPGTGKTKLAMCIGIISGDRNPSVRTPCFNEEEWKKSLLAVCVGAPPVLIYDNISKPIQGDAINAFLTSPTFSGRILGQTADTSGPTNTLMIFTGNNVQVIGDSNRRILRCRLESNVEHPENRKFKIDPVAYCLENQSALIGACLTLIRGFLNHGKNSSSATGSFETWDKLVRQTVIWINSFNIIKLGDPNESFKINDLEDIEKNKLVNLLVSWYACYGNSELTVKELLQTRYNRENDKSTDLKEAISEIIGTGQIEASRCLSWYLRKAQKRVIKNLRLTKSGTRRGVDLWRVVKK